MKKFFAGNIAMFAINSLNQDLLGKDKYIKLIEIAWVDAVYTVPMAIILLVIAVLLYRSKTPIS